MSLPPDIKIDNAAISFGAGVDKAIDAALDDKRLVGAVVLIMQDGKPVYRRAAGLADREAGLAMTEDTIFRFASVTKPIVTIAAMRLVEQGRMGLDDPITRWLPDFRPRLADGGEAVIRLRHLLTHTAGLSYCFIDEDGPYTRAGVSDGIGEPGMALAENLKRIASAPLRFAPGEGWCYSLAIDVLGGVIEQEMAMSLDDAVAELVTGPLGLTDTAFSVRDRKRLAAAYFNASPEPERMGQEAVIPALTGSVRFAPDRIFDPSSYHSGGAGMAGTADDILRILETIRQGGGALLSAETVATMMTDQANGLRQQVEPGSGFGFGWAVVTDPDAAQVPLSGGSLQWGGVYGHSWFVDPTKKLTVVALTNTALEGMWGRFTVDLKQAIYAAI
ncbi:MULTISPECIES: serine hydrolase domain-containing protein [unclassified Rhizobium]|uniref:serine hydrolase domain-containing protein n=1 Tax=unclassified Rhizobium TaxID=2613769 RepID=UPI001ADBC936|nr:MULTISPECIES: serine hydrolase domain-containing protein [unclassified Rhizobium]MBO9123413.1 beta-lactamase family protein [Rhizobium sp. 16-488-2b]MBO9173945.1 beta-lactamase family protein [Rhizobium sp. 16-488-2a]